MQDLAVVARIDSIEKIPNKDNIVLATVCNYKVIVTKDFKVGDLCVYVLADTILPESNPAFEFLKKRCYAPKYKGYKIRAMKLGGVVSEGIVFSMGILPKGNYEKGDSVADVLGVTKYDPEAEAEASADAPKKKRKGLIGWLMRFGWFRKLAEREAKGYPSWVTKSDETNIEKLYDDSFDSHGRYTVTEKIEGMATSYIYEDGDFWVCSHNKGASAGAWVDYAKSIGLGKKMKAYCKSHKVKRLCVQGELVGPGIQQNIYKLDGLDFYMYGGFIADKKESRRLTIDEMHAVSDALGLKEVPFMKVWDGLPALDDMLKEADGKSAVNPNAPREGVVVRDYSGDRHFKVKSREYKVWFSNLK